MTRTNIYIYINAVSDENNDFSCHSISHAQVALYITNCCTCGGIYSWFIKSPYNYCNCFHVPRRQFGQLNSIVMGLAAQYSDALVCVLVHSTVRLSGPYPKDAPGGDSAQLVDSCALLSWNESARASSWKHMYDVDLVENPLLLQRTLLPY